LNAFALLRRRTAEASHFQPVPFFEKSPGCAQGHSNAAANAASSVSDNAKDWHQRAAKLGGRRTA